MKQSTRLRILQPVVSIPVMMIGFVFMEADWYFTALICCGFAGGLLEKFERRIIMKKLWEKINEDSN